MTVLVSTVRMCVLIHSFVFGKQTADCVLAILSVRSVLIGWTVSPVQQGPIRALRTIVSAKSHTSKLVTIVNPAIAHARHAMGDSLHLH